MAVTVFGYGMNSNPPLSLSLSLPRIYAYVLCCIWLTVITATECGVMNITRTVSLTIRSAQNIQSYTHARAHAHAHAHTHTHTHTHTLDLPGATFSFCIFLYPSPPIVAFVSSDIHTNFMHLPLTWRNLVSRRLLVSFATHRSLRLLRCHD